VDSPDLTVTLATGPLNGGLVLAADGSFIYTPDADYAGPDSFTYTVSDRSGGTGTGTVTLTVAPVNDAPVAVDDTAATDEDSAVTTGPVLTNDTDVDGGTLVLAGFDTAGTLGQVTDNGDGTFAYDPTGAFDGLAAGATATDSFTYTVSDGAGGTDTGTVTVTITGVNDAPVAVDDAYGAYAGMTLSISVGAGLLGNDSDPDGDGLSATTASGPDNGTLVLNDDGSFDYTPDDGFFGADSFDYTLSDGQGGSATASVTIDVIPDSDGDGIFDDTDNATFVFNPTQRDSNQDGIGNVVDPDLNNDGIVNALDLGLMAESFGMSSPVDPNNPTSGLDADLDGDGAVNGLDLGILAAFFGGVPGPSASDDPFA
jgi:VCBS repeat-containing protein